MKTDRNARPTKMTASDYAKLRRQEKRRNDVAKLVYWAMLLVVGFVLGLRIYQAVKS